jgi:hypothetical protein
MSVDQVADRALLMRGRAAATTLSSTPGCGVILCPAKLWFYKLLVCPGDATTSGVYVGARRHLCFAFGGFHTHAVALDELSMSNTRLAHDFTTRFPSTIQI